MISRSITPSHGLIFGFRWSLVGIVIALFYIASCDLIIPPDNNKPRYNSVIGEKRRPPLNPGGTNYQPTQSLSDSQANIDSAYGASESPDAGATLTTPAGRISKPEPLPPAPAAASEQPHAMNTPASAEEPGFWDHVAFWRDDAKPVMDAPVSERRAPVENIAANSTSASAPAAMVASGDLAPLPGTANPAQPLQVAANDTTYPTLSNTPARPSAAVTDDTRQRLGAARSNLEAERTNADADRATLARDAVAEPSLLSTMPQGATPEPLPPPPAGAPTVAPTSSAAPSSAFERLTSHPLTAPQLAPAPAPVAAAPAPVIAPVPMQRTASIAPADASIPLAPAAALEPIRLTPPPAQPVDIAPPPAIASVAPPANIASNGAMEPIRLTPPSGMMGDSSMATPPAASNGAIQLSQPRSYAQSGGYLPNSRYTQRHFGD